MERDTNRNYDQNGNNPQQSKKEYPGYTSDKKWGTPGEEFIETDAVKNEIEDARLAESGPVRNPNYHNLSKEDQEGQEEKSALKKSTLKDYNETDPKRDINQDGSGNPNSEN